MDRPWLASYDQPVSRTLDVPSVPITHLLSSAVAEQPQGTAIHFFGRAITYGELGSLVDRFANALHRLGVQRGERVAIALPNVPQYVIAHWAIMRLGALVVPTNPLYTERELGHQLHDSGAETVVILDLLLPRLERIRQHLPIKHVIVASIDDFLPPLPRL
ncbi:MAG: AMP-binding protein, partial [Calditrichaeota bacterium]|nr:AMP-binding protein [Calditrichota bacterium]